MKYFIKIVNNNKLIDEPSLKEIRLLGFDNVESVIRSKIYSISGEISSKEIKFICENILVDPIIENYQINKPETFKNSSKVNIWYKPLVLDIVAKNVEQAIKYLGITKKLEVHSGTQVTFFPRIKKDDVIHIVKKIYMNDLIQFCEILK